MTGAPLYSVDRAPRSQKLTMLSFVGDNQGSTPSSSIITMSFAPKPYLPGVKEDEIQSSTICMACIETENTHV